MTRDRVEPVVGPRTGPRQPERARPRLRYHFHGPGLVYTLVTIVLALGAINSQNNLLFWALGLALSGLAASGLVSGASLSGIRISRLAVPAAAVGEPVRIRYAVSNTSRFVPAFGLTIVELPASRGAEAPSGFGPVRAFVLHVPPGATVEAEAVVIPSRRGAYRLAEVRASSTFPFGLARKSVTLRQPTMVLVRPARLTLTAAALALLTAEATGRRGARRSHDEDFYGLREFNASDPPGKVAWRVSARVDRPVVRREPPRGVPRVWLHLALDAAAEEEAERALALAGSLIREGAARGVAVGLSIPAARIVRPPRPGSGPAEDLLDQLALATLDAATSDAPSRALASEPVIVIRAGSGGAGAVPRGRGQIIDVRDISRLVVGPPAGLVGGAPGSAAA